MIYYEAKDRARSGGYFDFSNRSFRHYITDYQGNNIAITGSLGQIIEQTDYYPYGEPWQEPDHPFTYSDNERLHTFGQNQYDFHARRLVSSLLRFDKPDPLMEKYPWLSPYTFCGGNPIIRVDPDGRDIVVLLGKVHLAMLIQNKDQKWQYYSINGADFYVSGKFSGGRTFNDVGVGSWNSPQEFLDSDYNTKNESAREDANYNNYGFKEGYQIESTPEQDAIMAETFGEIANTSYELFTNNCATTVNRTLEAAGVNSVKDYSVDVSIPIPSNDIISDIKLIFKINPPKAIMEMFPDVCYSIIKKVNPGGIELIKTPTTVAETK